MKSNFGVSVNLVWWSKGGLGRRGKERQEDEFASLVRTG